MLQIYYKLNVHMLQLCCKPHVTCCAFNENLIHALTSESKLSNQCFKTLLY